MDLVRTETGSAARQRYSVLYSSRVLPGDFSPHLTAHHVRTVTKGTESGDSARRDGIVALSESNHGPDSNLGEDRLARCAVNSLRARATGESF